MSGTSEKLDSGLSEAYRAWCEHPEVSPDAGISILLTFQGDLAAIEALGFETHTPSRTADNAMGVVRFKDIARLQKSAGVLWMAAGTMPKRDLDVAARDIKARATVGITGSTRDGVWQAPVNTGTITSIAHATGKDVIVAIMDTGIDFTHPMFLKTLTPTKTTRILQIWDQGLTPTAITDCPKKELLEDAKTFGVVFDSKKIEDHLNGVATIAHKDCAGHGTHVAGIAAGGTLFAKTGDASKVGVAPEADLIVVKFLDTPDTIHYRKPDGTEDTETVGARAKLRDAICWCLHTAAAEGKPVVINMSFGDDAKPGDGLDEDAQWADEKLDPLHAADETHFPKGAILVKSAGNEGPEQDPEPGEKPFFWRRVARIKIPHFEETILPLRLVDERQFADTSWDECTRKVYSPSVGVHFWYRHPDGNPLISFALKLPNGDLFGAAVGAGLKHELGFRPIAGPPPHDIAVPFSDKVHRYTLDHQDPPAVPHFDGGTVRRRYVRFFVDPLVTAGTVAYHPGVYEMRIRAPQDTVIFLICDKEGWGPGDLVFFQVAERTLEQPDRDIDPTEIKILDEFSSPDPWGRHVITVSSYNDTNGKTSDPLRYHIAGFSSRGPLRDYSDPAAPKSVIPKPDIAAPGVRINSARTKDDEPGLTPHDTAFNDGVRFQEMSGTSMAVPMITGAIALMLEKNHNLSATDVRTHLSKAPRAGAFPATQPEKTNAFGAGMVDVLTTHDDVP